MGGCRRELPPDKQFLNVATPAELLVAIGENFAQHEVRCAGGSGGAPPGQTGKNFA